MRWVPPLAFFDLAQRFERQIRVFSVGEDGLASGHPAVDVIGRVWDEQAGFSRHGISFHARGRDPFILLPTAKHHNVIHVIDRIDHIDGMIR